MQQLLGLEAVEVIETDYSYQRLDGVDRSGQHRLAPDQPTLYLQGGLDVRSEHLEECVLDLHSYFGYGPEIMTAAGPDSWLGGLDKIALTLADAPAPKAPIIAAEETLLLNFEGELQQVERGTSDIHLLKDGEYVLFTIIVTNFRGGSHRFVFYFDEGPVAELTAVLQWPESLQFTAGDEALFRADSDVNTDE